MGYDIISELPESLITQILLWLPTKDSVKTSVLSTRWRNLWRNVPGLDLHSHDFHFPYRDVFNHFTERFLEFNSKSRLQKFKITNDHCKYNACSDRLKQWIATAVDCCGVQHLDVETLNPLYLKDFMPMGIYKSKTLVSLKLVNVGLLNPEFDVSLPCLKILHLENVWYGDGGPLIVQKLISGCLVLEDLTMVTETMPLLRVSSKTLKNFRLMLDTVSDVKFGSSLLKPDELGRRNVIREFLTGVSSVRRMTISQHTVEVIHHYSKLRGEPIPKFHHLSHLKAAFSSSSLQVLPAILESCPNLKNLQSFHLQDLSVVSTEPEQIVFTNVPRCLTSTLECVKINKLIRNEATGIKLVQYFSKNSAVLKKLKLSFTLTPMSMSTTNQSSGIFKTYLSHRKRDCRYEIIIS